MRRANAIGGGPVNLCMRAGYVWFMAPVKPSRLVELYAHGAVVEVEGKPVGVVLCAWDRDGRRGWLVETGGPLLPVPEGWTVERWEGWAREGRRAWLVAAGQVWAAELAADSGG